MRRTAQRYIERHPAIACGAIFVALLAGTAAAQATAPGTTRYVTTYDTVLHARRTQVRGTDKGCVSVTGWDLAVTSITIAEPSHNFWDWAHRVDSVSRLPATRRPHEALDFEPILFGRDDQIAYHRVVGDERTEEHYVAFVTSYRYLFGTWMTTDQLSLLLQSIVRAAKVTDSISIGIQPASCDLF